jgi:hypothetical protein
MSASITVYPPLDVLKRVAPDIWISTAAHSTQWDWQFLFG